MKNLSLEGWATQWTRCWVFVCSLGQLLLTFALPGKGALTVEMFSKQVKERMEGSQSKDKVQSTKRPLGTEENLPKLHAAVFLPTTLSSITEQDQVQGSLCERKRKTKQNKKKNYQLILLTESSTCQQIWQQPLSSSSSTFLFYSCARKLHVVFVCFVQLLSQSVSKSSLNKWVNEWYWDLAKINISCPR